MALMNKNLFFQLFRFGIVGVSAGAVHFSVVVFFVEMSLLKPLFANIIAFMIAFQVSYSGHRYWTFRGTVTDHRVAFPKLFLVSTLTFFANESLFYVFMSYFQLPYQVALLIVLTILPITTFALSKFWVFRS